VVKDQGKFERIFKIIDRVIFDLLVSSAANQSLRVMTDLLIELLSNSDEAVVHLVKHRVFVPDESLGKDEKNFFEMLATHQDQNVRQMASRVLVFVLNRLLVIGGEENAILIDDAITRTLDLMPNECQKHWMRLDTYLSFIYELTKSNIQFLYILTKKRTVTRLMDLMCKYNPNAMVYVATAPPLEKLVLTVSFIVRSIPCIVDP